MSVEDLRERLADFWGEFRKVRFGLAGVVLLAVFVLLVAFEPLLTPYPQAGRRWNDIRYWDDNTVSAPPVWLNLLSRRKAATFKVLRRHNTESEQSEGMRLERYSFLYEYGFDRPPPDLILHVAGEGVVPLIFALERPDGEAVEIARAQLSLQEGQDGRITADKDARAAALDFLKRFEPEEALARLDPDSLEPTQVFFAVAEPGMLANPRPLKGEYRILVTALLLSGEAKVRDPYVVVTGWVSGFLGTDNSKRDVFSGVVAGVKWALLIGLATASVAVVLGVFVGIISAYYGGAVDWLLQRLYELFQNIPLLPLLIVLAAVFKPSIWSMILIMMLFFWTGPVKTVYSIALQIKEETYVEAARALGASKARIIFRHMVPLLLPYSFASMALYLPSVIVYEATVSLLGLGDATIVTWGRILHDALSGGAVINRLWWWVIPPGLMIALMGMTFAFIGFAMDKILHPKLRTR